MCLGRVKGTRVATSAANGWRTAGCSGQTGRKGGMPRGSDALARRASRARYRDEFHSPDRFQRRGRDAEGRFRDRESAASQIREGYDR